MQHNYDGPRAHAFGTLLWPWNTVIRILTLLRVPPFEKDYIDIGVHALPKEEE